MGSEIFDLRDRALDVHRSVAQYHKCVTVIPQLETVYMLSILVSCANFLTVAPGTQWDKCSRHRNFPNILLGGRMGEVLNASDSIEVLTVAWMDIV